MKRWRQTMALLGLSMLLCSCVGLVGPERPPAMDSNGNKIFDSLERLMEKLGEEETVPVLIMMDEQSDVQKLDEVGQIDLRMQYTVVPAVAATMTRAQIADLAQKEYVQHIEHDAEVRVLMNSASDWFGVAEARQEFGVSGDRDGSATGYSTDDVVVAVIDTGKSISYRT